MVFFTRLVYGTLFIEQALKLVTIDNYITMMLYLKDTLEHNLCSNQLKVII